MINNRKLVSYIMTLSGREATDRVNSQTTFFTKIVFKIVKL